MWCSPCPNDAITIDALIHPGTAALVFAGIKIQKELADHLAMAVPDLIKTNLLVPPVYTVVDRRNLYLVEPRNNIEQSLYHPLV
jgi:hypothetical protein